MGIRTLAMIKMEKNFKAHNEKGYFRKPYLHYDLRFWLYRLEQEMKELREAFEQKTMEDVREELGDMSNVIDFAFERTLIDTFENVPLSKQGKVQLFQNNQKLENKK